MNKMKTIKVTIEKKDDDNAYFIIPDEYIEAMNWKVGDSIEWIENDNGSWTLMKVNSDLVE